MVVVCKTGRPLPLPPSFIRPFVLQTLLTLPLLFLLSSLASPFTTPHARLSADTCDYISLSIQSCIYEISAGGFFLVTNARFSRFSHVQLDTNENFT